MFFHVLLKGFQVRQVKAADVAAEPEVRDLFRMVHPGMAVTKRLRGEHGRAERAPEVGLGPKAPSGADTRWQVGRTCVFVSQP